MPQLPVEKKTSNDVALFAARIATLCILLNYVLGGLPTLMFVVGWWWGIRSSPVEDGELY